MRVTMRTRKGITEVTRQRYQKSSRKEKSEIPDEVCEITGWHRKHAARVLNEPVPAPVKRGSVQLVKPQETRGGKPVCTDEALAMPRKVRAVLDRPCGKRLAAVMEEALDSPIRFGEVDIDGDAYGLLCRMPAATCDRLPAFDREKAFLEGRPATKPGPLLRSQVPVRTFADRDEGYPGFPEIDLVARCGTSTRGEYVGSPDATDAAAGWAGGCAVISKAAVHTAEAVDAVKGDLPSPS